MTYDPRLEAVPLFSGLSPDDLERLGRGITEVRLPTGATLFEEGQAGDTAYVIADGEMEIVKTSPTGTEVLLAVHRAGTVVGEMALLRAIPRSATGRARVPTTLLAIPKATLDELLDTNPSATRQLFDVVLDRWQNTEVLLRQSERMAQIGTLTAGLAHELNNPAAAVKRGADQLAKAVANHAAAYSAAALALPEPDERSLLEDVLADAAARAGKPPELDPLTRSDHEAEIEDWLNDRDVPRAWAVAPCLAEIGFDAGALDGMARRFPADALSGVVSAIAATYSVRTLLREVEEGATRMSAIVKALKSYVYLDQAPVQEVDVTVGLDDTLLILRGKLRGITVEREYDPATPKIEAYGSELNQVWTNLIDNAADAIRETGREDGRIIVRAMPGNGGVAVEVEDNGPGIPPEIQDRIFDAFFTTKPPGSGTGLGLEVTLGIVMNRHGGDIEVRSDPGRTVFRVQLPLSPPSPAQKESS